MFRLGLCVGDREQNRWIDGISAIKHKNSRAHIILGFIYNYANAHGSPLVYGKTKIFMGIYCSDNYSDYRRTWIQAVV